MKKIIQFIRHNLDLSISEAKGVLHLSIIILICMISTFIYSEYSAEEKSKILIQEYGGTPVPIEHKNNYYSHGYSNNYSGYEKKYNYGSKSQEIHPFNFDPNTITQTQMKSLGLPNYLSKIIENYRSKNGVFRYKEDLLRIYGMKPELYESLSAYIQLSSKTENINRSFEENAEMNVTKFENKPKYVAKVIEKFDINMADTTQLIALKGIGSVFAKRILKYRDALGGFYDIDQISETYGMSPETMVELKKYAVVNGNFKRYNINQTKLIKHPYLNYNQINAIQNYRAQHGNFKNLDDLRKIKILDEALIQKMTPYLTFE